MSEPDDQFEQYLSHTLSAREMPRLSSRISAMAIERAEGRDAHGAIDALARRRRWGARINLVATTVLAVLATIVVISLAPRGADSAGSVGSSVQGNAAVDASVGENGTGMDSTDMLLLSGTALFATLLILGIERAMAGERRAALNALMVSA